MSNTLLWLFGILNTFVKVNVHANCEPFHKDYTFVLESTGPSVAALALDHAWADACQPLVALVPVENNGSDVKVEGSRVEEVVKVEVVVPKVLVAP
jgi:hypothetical protein